MYQRTVWRCASMLRFDQRSDGGMHRETEGNAQTSRPVCAPLQEALTHPSFGLGWRNLASPDHLERACKACPIALQTHGKWPDTSPPPSRPTAGASMTQLSEHCGQIRIACFWIRGAFAEVCKRFQASRRRGCLASLLRGGKRKFNDIASC